METDPYSAMVSLMRGERDKGASLVMRLGKVTQREPLRVSTAGIDLDAAMLRIHERLAKGARQRVRLSGLGTESEMAEMEQTELDLEAGDQVLLLTEDDQIFYLICKVVAAK